MSSKDPVPQFHNILVWKHVDVQSELCAEHHLGKVRNPFSKMRKPEMFTAGALNFVRSHL